MVKVEVVFIGKNERERERERDERGNRHVFL